MRAPSARHCASRRPRAFRPAATPSPSTIPQPKTARPVISPPPHTPNLSTLPFRLLQPSMLEACTLWRRSSLKLDRPPHIADLRRRAARLEAEVTAQQAAEEQVRSLQRVIGQLDLFAAMVHDRLADADWSTKRDIICTLVRRIKMAADSVRIVFRLTPAPSAPPE